LSLLSENLSVIAFPRVRMQRDRATLLYQHCSGPWIQQIDQIDR